MDYFLCYTNVAGNRVGNTMERIRCLLDRTVVNEDIISANSYGVLPIWGPRTWTEDTYE